MVVKGLSNLHYEGPRIMGSTSYGMVNGLDNIYHKGLCMMWSAPQAMKRSGNLHYKGPCIMRLTPYGMVKRLSNLDYGSPYNSIKGVTHEKYNSKLW